MNILFVSLMRFGDLLQTQAVITDVGKAGHQTGIVCLQNFLPTVHLLRHTHHVFPFIGSSLLSRLNQVQSESVLGEGGQTGEWLSAVQGLAEWREMVWTEFPPDVVINLSPQLSSRLLTRYMARNAPVGGFDMDNQAHPHNMEFWAGIMQGAPGLRGNIPYNLVDIFRAITDETFQRVEQGMAGHDFMIPHGFLRTEGRYGDPSLQCPDAPVLEEALAVLNRELMGMGYSYAVEKTVRESHVPAVAVQQSDKKVAGFAAIQLGASARERQWPVEHFACVGQYLWDTYRLVPVLLGTKNEAPLAEQYQELTPAPCIPLCGKTGVLELSATLRHCQLLVTNDTGTMHLAAGLNIPSFAMFLATAQPFDTGPYLPGCYCFEPDLPCHPCGFSTACPHANRCLHSIRPEAVIACMEHFFKKEAVVASSLNGSRVWLSGIAPDGSLALRRLGEGLAENILVEKENSGDGLTGACSFEDATVAFRENRAAWIVAQRNIAWALFRQFQAIRRCANEPVTQPFEIDVSELHASARERIAADALILSEQLDVLEKQGQVLLLRSVPLMRERFMESWFKVTAILGDNPWFNWVYSVWVDLTQDTALSFNQILESIWVFLQLFRDIQRNLAT